ncbi:hypothetical protein BDZ94DRAFT_1270224 [Collybia nuda]|uniref:Uncharacterized protein n=1 Tax=Collybia nuda TaxID=64659 RepID=A0A9P5XXI6_9AGAR|nr:hypothetical protein BDZ94DRAFT_1270224 [Collybia nuda]
MSSTSQNISDSALLEAYGKSLVHGLVNTSMVTLFYGIFVLLYVQAVLTHLKIRGATRPQLLISLMCSFTFILATVEEVALLSGSGIAIHSILIGYKDLPLEQRFPLLNQRLLGPTLVNMWIPFIQFIISDAVLVWRAFVLMQRRRWLMILPLLLLLGSAASLFADVIIKAVVISKHQEQKGFLPANGILEAAGVCLSLATNVVATAVFTFIYWNHRRDVTAGLGRHQTTQAVRVLALLVESGVIYCLVQAVYVILGFFSGGSLKAMDYIQRVVDAIFFGLSGIYPTAVVALVHGHRTLSEMYTMDGSLRGPRNGVDPDIATTLQFAVPVVSTSTETASHHSEKTDREVFGSDPRR